MLVCRRALPMRVISALTSPFVRQTRVLLQYPINTNNLIERYHRTLKTVHTNERYNKRVFTLISQVLLITVAQFHVQKIRTAETKAHPKMRQQIMSREESAQHIVDGKQVQIVRAPVTSCLLLFCSVARY